ncbi:MAG: bifunctional phosphoribosyl-AMP cyclohydrolase/phosphoribosyl-ATP diphosphatase HisIE [Gammaproteobacteria bacterium]
MSFAEPSKQIRWNEAGLIPVIAQDAGNGRVLMLAWMNAEALQATIASGEAVYWSRSRGQLWRKGETSGHLQKIRDIRLDCDNDALLLLVEQVGGIACHTNRESCFFQELQDDLDWRIIEQPRINPSVPFVMNDILRTLAATLEDRKGKSPNDSYVASLYSKGIDTILKKIGEEATETVIAAKNGEPEQLVRETADLWFHTLVMLAYQGLGPDPVLRELQRRFGTSGLAEKESRKESAKR